MNYLIYILNSLLGFLVFIILENIVAKLLPVSLIVIKHLPDGAEWRQREHLMRNPVQLFGPKLFCSRKRL